MAPRVSWPAGRRRLFSPTISISCRQRFFTTSKSALASGSPARLTITSTLDSANSFPSYVSLIPKTEQVAEKLANPNGHNAAVLLVTPEAAKGLENPEHTELLVKQLAAGADIDKFHLIYAVVDHVAPPPEMYTHAPGISLLRCHIEDLSPKTKDAARSATKEDADKVGAIEFEMGQTCVTLPLARTTFLNGKTSTLVHNLFGMQSNSSPTLERATELRTTRIRLPTVCPPPQSTKDFSLRTPLFPATRPRIIKESFGNIVRGIEVEEEKVPASQELELAINGLPPSQIPGPVGIWAAVTPESCPPNDTMDETLPPAEVLELADDSIDRLVDLTDCYLESTYRNGGRVFKVLSGGGGWGAKKGLLSLDPEETHFTLPEEEDLHRFTQMMDGSSCAPVGSRIQFFLPAPKTTEIEATGRFASACLFGVPGDTAPHRSSTNTAGMGNLFGALSKAGIFVSGPQSPGTGNVESKWSVPHSRVILYDEGTNNREDSNDNPESPNILLETATMVGVSEFLS